MFKMCGVSGRANLADKPTNRRSRHSVELKYLRLLERGKTMSFLFFCSVAGLDLNMPSGVRDKIMIVRSALNGSMVVQRLSPSVSSIFSRNFASVPSSPHTAPLSRFDSDQYVNFSNFVETVQELRAR